MGKKINIFTGGSIAGHLSINTITQYVCPKL